MTNEVEYFALSYEDVVSAYKRAKIDAWYAHSLDIDEVVRFESDFATNIKTLHDTLEKGLNGGRLVAPELGGWRLETKGIAPPRQNDDRRSSTTPGVMFSNPRSNPCQMEDIGRLTFRMIATPSLLFHVISALWIIKVGHKFDSKLGSHAYGNRLRKIDKKTRNGQDNRAGSFVYYIKKFSQWRESALKYVMKSLKDLEEKIVVVTADAHSFYHCLKPDFLTNQNFLGALDVDMNPFELQLTRLLQNAINIWAKDTPLKGGLPVSLPASAVIANVALCEFDKIICDDIQPLYYGRYVDDILLVFKWIDNWVDKKKDNRNSLDKIWEWLAKKSDADSIKYVPSLKGDQVGKVNDSELIFDPKGYGESLTVEKATISFKGSKCKAFFLDPETGLPFVDALKKQIKNLSSEFRLLPENVGDEVRIRTKIRRLIPGKGDVPDNFRKIDTQEFRRSDFMALLKELESFEKVLPGELWNAQRKEFYNSFTSILMTWPHFVDFEKYIPRIVGLMVRNADFEDLQAFIRQVGLLVQEANNLKTRMYISGPGDVSADLLLDKWEEPLKKTIKLSILSNVKGVDCSSAQYPLKYGQFITSDEVRDCLRGLPNYYEAFEKYSRTYLIHDVSNERFSMFCQRTETRYLSKVSALKSFLLSDCLPYSNCIEYFGDECAKLLDLLGRAVNGHSGLIGGVPFGLLFPTRPISMRNIAYFGHALLKKGDARKIIKCFRGYEISKQASDTFDSVLCENNSLIVGDAPHKIIVADKNRNEVNVALMSIRTSEDLIHLEMKASPPAGLREHYIAVVKLVNDVLRNHTRPEYIVFHELGLPPLWFVQLAEKCFSNGVSVLSGVDYIMGEEKHTCSNEIWMSLVALHADYPEHVFITEKKSRFAYVEEADLLAKYGYRQAKLKEYEKDHSIILHGRFAFTTLICSELMEMRKRCRLIGRIDALFVVSWNQDIETFAEIIKSTASDIHAYVIFCNNNLYGNSRVRVPRKERWARDVVEVRGGEDPYFVVGKLEVEELRKFQSYSNPNLRPDARFKPLPMGFEIDGDRKVDV